VLLGFNRSWFYYKPVNRPEPQEKTDLKGYVTQEYMTHPFYGYRRITIALSRKGHDVTQKKVRTAMIEMNMKAIYPKPNLSKPGKGHRIYKYLLEDLTIDHANQVWATDITYIKLNGSFVYLTAVIDLFSRKVLTYRLSNSMDAGFCVEALLEAFDRFGKPEIFNTDQGSQFTSEEFTDELNKRGIRVSMDGKGRALDNVYVERLWRSVKYENIYLNEYKNLKELKGGVKSYFEFFNTERYHQSLEYATPDEVYYFSRNSEKEVSYAESA
jgi:putative transposase